MIGAFVARNAGTDFSGSDGHVSEANDSRVVDRLLELAAAGRAGPPDVLVNEAVANASGQVCRNYAAYPAAAAGCQPGNWSPRDWQDAGQVRAAAQALGFACSPPDRKTLTCTFRLTLVEHPVRFILLPSIDGLRSGRDREFEDVATLLFARAGPPTARISDMPVSRAR